MKKIVLLIIGVLLILPNIVFADMGAPYIEKYKATVNNKNGAIIYKMNDNGEYVETSKKLSYGKTISIEYEEGGYAVVDDGYIKTSDIIAVKDNYEMKSSDWEEKTTAIVLKRMDIRKGPAGGYSSIGVTIEPGTKVTIRESKLQESMSWVYVEYNGKKGYIDSYHGAIALREETGKIIVYSDAKLIDPETYTQKGTVKANTVLEGKYYGLDPWTRGYYFDTANVKGIISDYDVAIQDEEISGTLKRDIKVYDKIDEDNKNNMKVVTTLKAGTVLKSTIYNHYNWAAVYYYENGNTKGWVYDENVEKPYTGDDSVDEDTDPKYGFALEYDMPEDNEEDTGEEVLEDNSNSEITKPYDEEKDNDNDDTQLLKERNNPSGESKDRIYFYIMGAVVLCVTAVVTIILVNKKEHAK